jgi:glycosyltransferase involved in cell wall biosynthesis
MRILVFHGYLLSGTGSNVYNARLAEALVRLGHEVHLLCQERHPERHLFVEAAGDWEGGKLETVRLQGLSGDRPRCTAYRPDIGGLLPLYVHDRYEGTEAKTFAECSDLEIDVYLRANVEAVREVAERVHPDVALANHLVMGPVILARALAGATPYAVKVHGSALEYTVKPEPERFLGFAHEGLARAQAVLVGSRHTAESLWQALGETEGERVRRRTRLGPPGVDVKRFAPHSASEAEAAMRGLLARLHDSTPGPAEEQSSAFARDDQAAAEALGEISRGNGMLVAYVGKLIVSKGVDLLLAAWPLVLGAVPGVRLVVVGFGAYRAGLEELLARLAQGDLEGAKRIARAGRSLEEAAGESSQGGPSRSSGAGDLGGESSVRGLGEPLSAVEIAGRERRGASKSPPLRHLLAFLDSLSGSEEEAYRDAARALAERVVFTGRLDHEELADVLPGCEALVVPSTFPEAFGMVAAEAAACGVLPVSAAHSGLAEVSEALHEEVPDEAGAWLSFPVDDDAVRAIAERLIAWLEADRALKARTREALVSVVGERWSWEGVARGVIAAARGEPVLRPFG